MLTEQFFNLLLDLDENWSVQDIAVNDDDEEVFIKVSYVGHQVREPDSKVMRGIYDHAPERKWRHLDTLQYKTYIQCRLPRVKTDDGNVITIIPPWASKHGRHSYLFECFAIDLLRVTKNQTKTAELLRCSFNVINRLMHASTQRGLARRDLDHQPLNHLSIDEKSFKKGHHYISVLSSPETGNIIDVVEGRSSKAVEELFDGALTTDQQKAVQTMSMDMWQAYRNVTQKKMPDAEIVHDRFHLVKYLNDAIDKVRRREVKSEEELKNSRYALLKNPQNLTQKQRLKFQAIQNANYQVSKAWQVRENFKDLFKQKPGKAEGFALFTQWTQNALGKGIKEVSKVIKTFKDHLAGVVNALVYTASNGMAERLNGKIQAVKCSGRGYRRFKNFRSAILFFHGGLDLYPLKRQ